MREGLDFIQKAIAVKPDSHFGREQWQITTIEFLLAAIEKPELLRKCDLLGNRLGAYVNPATGRAIAPDTMWTFWARHMRDGDSVLRSNADECITHVGAEKDYPISPLPSIKEPIPFDEPVLGIIGMWRQGSGANPHFALCLGETMLRVGQRYLAWSAFERASRMADAYSPDAGIQEFLRDHCRRRQGWIKRSSTADEVAGLRPQFDAELAFGQRDQQEYAEYEAEQLAAGRLIDDEHFYDAFHAGREPIASPVGPEDGLLAERPNPMADILPGPRAGYAVFGMGLAAAGMAMLMRRR